MTCFSLCAVERYQEPRQEKTALCHSSQTFTRIIDERLQTAFQNPYNEKAHCDTMTSRNLESEIKVLKQLENLMEQKRGVAVQDPIRHILNSIIAHDFTKIPRSTLDEIASKLELLKNAGWDVERLRRRHSDLMKDLNSTIEELRQIPTYEHFSDPYEFADSTADNFKLLTYTFVDIRYLLEEVDCLCSNYVATVKKYL